MNNGDKSLTVWLPLSILGYAIGGVRQTYSQNPDGKGNKAWNHAERNA